MVLWIVDGVLLVAGFFASRRMYHRLQDYPANIFGRIRRPGEPASPSRD
jgi:hypothetical protein